MNHRTILTAGCAALMLLNCGTKEPPEEPAVDVDIPAVAWESSIALVNAREPSAEANAADDLLFQSLSGSKRLKVYHPSTASVPLAETRPDYVLEYDIEKKDDEYASRFILTDADRDTIWRGDSKETLLTAVEEASGAVASAVGHAPPGPARAGTLPPGLSHHFLEAEALLANPSRTDNERAIQTCKEILKEAPGYAPAAAALAEAYFNVIDRGWDRNLVWLRLAQEAALNALKEDPGSASAHAVLGQVHLKRGDYKQAEQAFRSALAGNPNLEEAWVGLGNVFSHYGLYEPSLDVYRNALALNPSNESAALSRALILIGLARYDEAESEIDRILRIDPGKKQYHTFLALIDLYRNDTSAALDQVSVGLESREYRILSHAVRGMAYAKRREYDNALYDLEMNVKPYVGTDASLATAVAAVYALIGQKGSALEWLHEAVRMGYREYPWLVNDPNFEELRSDERFRELLAHLKTEWEANMRQYSSL